MKKRFEITSQEDTGLLEVCFTDENKSENKADCFCMDIYCMTAQLSKFMEKKIISLKTMYDAEKGIDHAFEVCGDEKNHLVRITGNIANAFFIIGERHFSDELCQQIANNNEMKVFLKNSNDAGSVEISEKNTASYKLSMFNVSNENRTEGDCQVNPEPSLTFNESNKSIILVIPVGENSRIDMESITKNNHLARKLADECIAQISESLITGITAK